MEPNSAVPCAGFASLPRLLALDIFARLPADARLLLALVSPSWRALVAEPSLWACVDLSEGSGVTRTSDALLLAVSAKARGGMRSLDVFGQVWAVDERTWWTEAARKYTFDNLRPPISHAALLTTLRNNAHSFGHLLARCPACYWVGWRYLNHRATTAVLNDLLQAAPNLTQIEVDIRIDTFDALLLRSGVVGL